MKKWFLYPLLCLCLLLLQTATYAQTGICYIDLSSAAATLVQAQAQASSGDTASAIGKLRELQAQIDAIIAGCEGTTTNSNAPLPTNTPLATPVPALDTVYVSENGLLSFVLPGGWVVFEEGNSVFIGTTENTTQALTQFNSPITGTDRGAALVLGTTQQLAPTLRQEGNFVDVLVAYQSQLGLVGFTMSEELTPITFRDLPGGRFTIQNENFSGIIQVIELQPNGLHLLLFVASAPDRASELETFLTDLLDSVEVNIP
ncbi:MAG: hypothetical protein SFZ02_20870 [bacterium]|nr:hypothetical protein [bacterium]